MVLPVIAVSFPDTATRAEVVTLLDACDHAFLRGDCVEGKPDEESSTEVALRANVLWLNETEAEVTVERLSDASSDSEQVLFFQQDEAIERYRALGFTIGSLAAAFTQPRDKEETAPEGLPPLVAPVPETRDVDGPPKPPPAAAVRLQKPLDPLLFQYDVEFGVVAGNGLASPRFGGEFGLWVPVYRRWVSQVSFGGATQPRTSSDVGATFLVGRFSMGPRFLLDRVLLTTTVGLQAQQLRVSLGEARLAREKPALGPVAAAHARFSQGRFSPFVSARLAYIDQTDLSLSQVDATGQNVESETSLGTHGPVQFDGIAGISIQFEP